MNKNDAEAQQNSLLTQLKKTIIERQVQSQISENEYALYLLYSLKLIYIHYIHTRDDSGRVHANIFIGSKSFFTTRRFLIEQRMM